LETKIYVVEFTKFAAKQIQRVPKSIQEAIFLWKEAVEQLGLPEVMKAKGYHDEPLKGQRKGQRSVRLNRAYRLIYTRLDQGEIVVVGVQEVNKHEY
jgi:proteic killer suppression protein